MRTPFTVMEEILITVLFMKQMILPIPLTILLTTKTTHLRKVQKQRGMHGSREPEPLMQRQTARKKRRQKEKKKKNH